MNNYVDFFRFSDKYEDVFIEGDHLLYTCAEPHGWAYVLGVCEYKGVISCCELFDPQKPETVENVREWIISDYAGADVEYLQKLTPAPPAVAAAVIKAETAKTAAHSIDDADDRAAYVEYKSAEIDHAAEKLGKAE